MVSLKNLPTTLETLLTTTAEETAREHRVIQRVRAFNGAALCQTLVFGYLDDPDASLSQLCQAAATCEVQVTRQAIDQRLKDDQGERIATWLETLVGHAARQAIRRQPQVDELLARFPGVVVEDTTILTLPDALAALWPGCGGSAGASRAALKLSLRLDLSSGVVQGPLLAPGRRHDRTLADAHAPLPRGTLYIADLGYFSLSRFQELLNAGVHVLSRFKAGTSVVDAAGRTWDAAAFLAAQGSDAIDVPVHLGKEAHFACRLLAISAPRAVVRERRRRIRREAKREGRTPGSAALALAAWTIAITTLPPERLSLADAMALLHARWQIELLWKGWKTAGRLRLSRSTQPTHIRAELCAKLLGLIIQQWLLLLIGYRPLEHSWVLATHAIRSAIRPLAAAIWRGRGVRSVIRLMARAFPRSARIPPRRARPSTAQLLRHTELACLN
jgi:hypothetical protein